MDSIVLSSKHDTSQLSSALLHNNFTPRPLYRFINPKLVSYASLGRLTINEEIDQGYYAAKTYRSLNIIVTRIKAGQAIIGKRKG